MFDNEFSIVNSWQNKKQKKKNKTKNYCKLETNRDLEPHSDKININFKSWKSTDEEEMGFKEKAK